MGTLVGGGTPTADSKNWDGDVPFVTPPDLRPVVGSVVHTTQRTLTAEGAAAGSSTVPEGSVLLSIRAPIGYVAKTSSAMAFNQGCRAIVPYNGTSARYLTYALVAAGAELDSLGRGTTFMELSAAQMAALELPVPPLEEQRAIADYLDRETARIDTLIKEQQRLIEMLRERRQAVIDDAFSTLGEPSVQLRRYIDFLTSGSRGWGDYYADQGERFLRIGNLPRANLEIRGEIQFVNLPADVTEGSRTMLQKSDLLFSITAYLGSVAVVEGDWLGAYVSQHVALCRLDCDRVDSRFIGWFMLSTIGQNQLNEGAAGGTKMQLALDDIRELRVPTAPVEQQRRIAAHLDRQTAKIDALVTETERFIEYAHERRAALITAAVTGQIDVREMV
ncbi:restriction endonuclease subunit S [Plantactinospora veratri]|uniref:Restriction endonuclease subunit S n=1 Tax=Plantactinospora veratri TaxID=1436122 RepID=A0ABU7SE41_9ACTN